MGRGALRRGADGEEGREAGRQTPRLSLQEGKTLFFSFPKIEVAVGKR